jgi:hypothetical protein
LTNFADFITPYRGVGPKQFLFGVFEVDLFCLLGTNHFNAANSVHFRGSNRYLVSDNIAIDQHCFEWCDFVEPKVKFPIL